MQKILLLIDIQNDFISGALGTEEAKEMVPKLIKYLKESGDDYDGIAYTMDTHQDDYLETAEGKFIPIPHCVEGSDGWLPPYDLIKFLYQKFEGRVYPFEKDRFGLKDIGRGLELVFKGIDDSIEIDVCGLCTDICVLANLVQLFFETSEKNKIRLLSTYCAGSTPKKHEKTLALLKGLGIEVV